VTSIGVRAVLAALAGVVVLGLTACGSVADAGTRVSPTTSTSAQGSVPPAGSQAPADLVAAADLADCPASDPTAAARDDGLPDLTLPCLGAGSAVRLAGLRGTPTIVNAWAAWCGDCRSELGLFADLAGAAHGSVRLVGIDVQDDPASALSLLRDAGVHYASVRDDERRTQVPLRWTGLPATYFVDAAGVVTFVQRGAIRSADQLRALVHDHLGVTVAP